MEVKSRSTKSNATTIDRTMAAVTSLQNFPTTKQNLPQPSLSFPFFASTVMADAASLHENRRATVTRSTMESRDKFTEPERFMINSANETVEEKNAMALAAMKHL